MHYFVRIYADLAKSVPAIIIGVRMSLSLHKEHIRLAQWFFSVVCNQQSLCHRAVSKYKPPLHILRPDHVRHIVAHQSHHGIKLPVPFFTLPK